MTTLKDLGEREILKSIIPKFTQGIGDDCAVIQVRTGSLIITTDPVPPPAAMVIGRDEDPYWMGWLLVTINVSDLSASGAKPLSFVAALEAQPDTSTENFERLLMGIRDACDESGLAYVGGNIREGKALGGVGTAVGMCAGYRPLTRTGAKVGDLVISIGAGGRFWRDAFRLWDGLSDIDKEQSHVFKPRSQIRFVQEFARVGVINAAMDNSDGLLPTLSELANKNSCGVELDLAMLQVDDLKPNELQDAARFWMGWGDWNVIACVNPDNISEIQQIADRVGAVVTSIGKIQEGQPDVVLRRGAITVKAPRLESERFAADSWMTKGIGGYIQLLKELNLP